MDWPSGIRNMCADKEKDLTYSVDGENFLIVNLNFPWVLDYQNALEIISFKARSLGCKVLHIWFTREGTKKFLIKKGWKETDKGIMSYVL